MYFIESCLLVIIGSVLFYFVESIALLFIFGLCAFFLIAWGGASVSAEPMRHLNRSIAESAESDWERPIAPAPHREDEIGDIVREFESMRLLIKKCRMRVQSEVRAQTKEIAKRETLFEDQQSAILNILDDLEAEKNKLQEEKAKDDAILDNVGDGLIVLDRDARIMVMNVVAQELLGWAAARVVGKQMSEVVKLTNEEGNAVPPAERSFTQALLSGKKVSSSAYFLTRKNKTRFPAAISASPVFFGKKVIGVVNIFHDIAREKAIDRAKTEFVSLASHQLRTPLSAINWYAEMLLAGDVGRVNKEQKEYLDEIYRANKRMVALVSALLNVSRIELGTMAIMPEPTILSELAEDVLNELAHQISLKELRIVKEFRKDVPTMRVDPRLVRVIFQNLLSNAVKYTPAKGKINVSIARKDPDAMIRVEDSGYGIPTAVHPKIFTKLFRADNARERDAEGTGLGLYIVKSIVDQSGGNIWFESAENKGTTFFVTLPLAGMTKREGTKGPEEMTS